MTNLLVRVISKLIELADVQGPFTDGQLLSYDATTHKFIAVDPPSGGGGGATLGANTFTGKQTINIPGEADAMQLVVNGSTVLNVDQYGRSTSPVFCADVWQTKDHGNWGITSYTGNFIFQKDTEYLDANHGVVLIDRATGTHYRQYINNGVVNYEAI